MNGLPDLSYVRPFANRLQFGKFGPAADFRRILTSVNWLKVRMITIMSDFAHSLRFNTFIEIVTGRSSATNHSWASLQHLFHFGLGCQLAISHQSEISNSVKCQTHVVKVAHHCIA